MLPNHHLQIMAKNINTINTNNDYIQWQALIQAAINTKASLICIQVTNLQWSSHITHKIGQIICTTPLKLAKVAVSQSNEISLNNYKPGGTFTAALRPWASFITFHGANPIYGRWSYLEMEGKDVRCFVFVTGYQTGSQQPPKLGASTSYDQQFCLLQKHGYTNPNPPNQFIEDLITQIKDWRAHDKAVLICLDANEDVTKTTKQQGIGRISEETNLELTYITTSIQTGYDQLCIIKAVRLLTCASHPQSPYWLFEEPHYYPLASQKPCPEIIGP